MRRYTVTKHTKNKTEYSNIIFDQLDLKNKNILLYLLLFLSQSNYFNVMIKLFSFANFATSYAP